MTYIGKYIFKPGILGRPISHTVVCWLRKWTQTIFYRKPVVAAMHLIFNFVVKREERCCCSVGIWQDSGTTDSSFKIKLSLVMTVPLQHLLFVGKLQLLVPRAKLTRARERALSVAPHPVRNLLPQAIAQALFSLGKKGVSLC